MSKDNRDYEQWQEYIKKLRRPIRCSVRQVKIKIILLKIDNNGLV